MSYAKRKAEFAAALVKCAMLERTGATTEGYEIQHARVDAECKGRIWHLSDLGGTAEGRAIGRQCDWEHRALANAEAYKNRQCSADDEMGYQRYDCIYAHQKWYVVEGRIIECEERARAILVGHLTSLDSCDGWQKEYDAAAAKEKKLYAMRELAGDDITRPTDINSQYVMAAYDAMIWEDGLKQCIARLPKKE